MFSPHRLSMVMAGVAALHASTPVRADVSQGLLMLSMGQGECQTGRFASGIKKMTDAAVMLQQADPKHPGNRQWLPKVRTCLQSWVRQTGEVCRKSGTADALEAFGEIEKAMKYLAAPTAKRMVVAARPRCAADIVMLQSKTCLLEPGRRAVDGLATLRESLKGMGVEERLLGKLEQGRQKCLARWVKEADRRCQGASTVEFLKEIGDAVTRSGPATRNEANAAYERCAKAMGQRAFSVCQARRYQQGRAMLTETIARYGFFAHRDRAFLKRMQGEWLPRCGSYVATGYFKAAVRRGSVSFSLEARVTLEVGRGERGELLAELRAAYSAVSGKQQGCRVLITPTDGRYSLTGSENRATSTMKLALEKGMPQTQAFEEIQLTCGERPPDLSKGRFLHHLLARAGFFDLTLSTQQGARKAFDVTADLPARAKGSLAGHLTVKRLQETK